MSIEKFLVLPLQTIPHDIIECLYREHGHYPDLTEIIELFVQSIESVESYNTTRNDIAKLVSTTLINSSREPSEVLVNYFRILHARIKELFVFELPEFDNYGSKGWIFNMAILLEVGSTYETYTGEVKKEYTLTISLYHWGRYD